MAPGVVLRPGLSTSMTTRATLSLLSSACLARLQRGLGTVALVTDDLGTRRIDHAMKRRLSAPVMMMPPVPCASRRPASSSLVAAMRWSVTSRRTPGNCGRWPRRQSRQSRQSRQADHVVEAQVDLAIFAGFLHMRGPTGLPCGLFPRRAVVHIAVGRSAGSNPIQAARAWPSRPATASTARASGWPAAIDHRHP